MKTNQKINYILKDFTQRQLAKHLGMTQWTFLTKSMLLRDDFKSFAYTELIIINIIYLYVKVKDFFNDEIIIEQYQNYYDLYYFNNDGKNYISRMLQNYNGENIYLYKKIFIKKWYQLRFREANKN